MKELNSILSISDKSKISLSLIPEDVINTLLSGQEKILEMLSERKPPGLNGFLTEKQAIELVNKRTTWFWHMRKSGKLKFKKIGNTIYYSMEDINSLLRI